MTHCHTIGEESGDPADPEHRAIIHNLEMIMEQVLAREATGLLGVVWCPLDGDVQGCEGDSAAGPCLARTRRCCAGRRQCLVGRRRRCSAVSGAHSTGLRQAAMLPCREETALSVVSGAHLTILCRAAR